jgi:hypothetical protein
MGGPLHRPPFNDGRYAASADMPAPNPKKTRICARVIHHIVTPPHYGHRMGRPKVYAEPRVATAIRLPASLRDELLAAAAERDVSVNFLVTRAVTEYLSGLPAVSAGDTFRPQARRRRSPERAPS